MNRDGPSGPSHDQGTFVNAILLRSPQHPSRDALNDLRTLRIKFLRRRRKRLDHKRSRRLAVDEEPRDAVVSRDVEDVLRCDVGAKLLNERFRILRSDLKQKQASDVSEDCGKGSLAHLCEVLIGDGQVQPVLAGFAQDVGEGTCREILVLIDAEVKTPTIRLRHIRPTYRRLLDVPHQERFQQIMLPKAKLVRAFKPPA